MSALDRFKPTSGSTRPTVGDVVSGFVTALFSIPEGMAYASIGGFNPVTGLYSGMLPTVVGSMFARTVLMVTTLTSAIALSSQSVLSKAGLDPSNVGNLAMLTVLVGVVMLLLGLLKVGAAMNFVSSSVMTGFTVGIAAQIVAGTLKDITAYTPTAHNTLMKFVDCFVHIGEWKISAVIVAVATVAAWAAFRLIKRVASLATLLALAVVTVVVAVLHTDVETVGDIASVPRSLPPFTMPDWSAFPHLILGAFAISLVGLAQAAGISASVANPDGSRSNASGDFTAQGAANIVGGFFGSLGTGGSLSRTGVSVSGGAKTRWAGIFAGVWLVLLVLVAGPTAEVIPMPVIGGLLLVIGGELIVGRWADIKLVFSTAPLSAVALVVTFVATTQFPLQDAILFGAALSLIIYCVQAARAARLVAFEPDDGDWRISPVPEVFASDGITVLHYSGVALFAEAPRLDDQWPTLPDDAHHSVLILSVRMLPDVPSATLMKLLRKRVESFQNQGGRLMLAGVSRELMAKLRRAGVVDLLGEDNIVPADGHVLSPLDVAYSRAQDWLATQHQ